MADATTAAGFSSPRIALAHDWLTGMRGGEKILEVLAELYPSAHLFTLVHWRGSVSPTIERLRIRTSIVQRLPFGARRYRHFLPLFPFAVEQWDLDAYDAVVSTSHCAVKSVVRTGRSRHLCYCMTPMRYAWDQFPSYFGAERVGRLPSAALRPVLAALARWDRATSSRVDRYVAISQYVAARIGRYYNRRAEIVYPPVDTAFYHPDGRQREDFALVVSALVPYKRVDLAIAACRAASIPLRIVGDGPDRAKLEQSGSTGATFLGTLTDNEIRELYRAARMTILPGVEDFGIVPVEAQACGCPVVALRQGGVVETVRHGETGVLVDEPTAESLACGIERARTSRFDPDAARVQALRFSRERFRSEIRRTIDDMLNAPTDRLRW
ncbi:MAG: glycosyltransferase [Vicinamibacterales bacterium]